jgi:O-antigen/teichoic acid export membrane protein
MPAQFARKFSLSRVRAQRLGAEGSWILIGQIASVAGSLVSVRVLTGFLSPEQYGELALANTIGDLIGQVFTGGLVLGIGRFYSIALERGELNQYLRASRLCMGMAMLAVLCAAIAIIVGLGLFKFWAWIPLALACLIVAAVSSCNNVLSSIQTAARQRRIVALHSAGAAWLKLAVAASFLSLFGVSATAAAVSSAVAILCVTGSQLYFLRHVTRQHSNASKANTAPQWERDIWAFALPLSAWGLFTWIQQSSDRWALQTFSTTAELGQYAALFSLGYSPVSVMSGLLLTFVAPVAYQRAGSQTSDEGTRHVGSMLLRLTAVIVCLTLIAAVVAWMIHDWIFGWTVTSAYRSKSYLLPWVVIAGGFFSAGQVLALKQIVKLQTRSLLVPKVVTAVLAVGMNFVGAQYFGVDGVVAGLIGFSMLYFAWMFLLFTSKTTDQQREQDRQEDA